VNTALITASFVGALLIFLLIGVSSAWASRGTGDDYYLASRDVAPSLVGLSAVATNNSGYMFIGLMGYTYAAGLSSFWLMLGWILGDLLASLLVHRKLRKATAAGTSSFAGVLSRWHADGERWHILQKLAALISLIFLLTYASAQLIAGSKALHVLLDWPLWSGAVLGAVLVGIYCFSGGIRASIWTDAAQSSVMLLAMLTLLVTGVVALGGASSAVSQMQAIDGFMDWFPRDLALPGPVGALLFALGWLFAGFSVVGQPHIMVRFMALDNPEHITTARWWYYLWFLLFYGLATGVGMLSRIYLADPGQFDAELALPKMAAGLLPDFWIGVVLAGIFAATMSTADSLVLSCSAAITQDFSSSKIEATWVLKAATLGITGCALLLALFGPQNVFDLVLFAWSGLASAFAPLLLVYVLGGRPTQSIAIQMMLAGLAVAMGWRALGWQQYIYEGMPGILAGLFVFGVRRAAGQGVKEMAQIR